jgi:hypothetical protein
MDLCGIAKGYALDRIIEGFDWSEWTSVILNLAARFAVLACIRTGGPGVPVSHGRMVKPGTVVQRCRRLVLWLWRHPEPARQGVSWASAGSPI